MEKQCFEFTGLDWMVLGQITRLKNSLFKLTNYGIEYECVHIFKNGRYILISLEISNFDNTLLCAEDNSHITFIKNINIGKNENGLVIITIDDDMVISIKELNYYGEVSNILN